MKVDNNNLEKIISEALELQEKGRSIPEILSLFPEYKKELEEMFETIRVLASQKEKILPKQELLTKIISQINPEKSVTKPKISRYLYRGELRVDPL